jgi:hypothetical protein
MPDHGVDLGVDLYELLTVAKDNLPSVAAVYGDAVAKYGNALDDVDDAMRRPDHFGGGMLGPVHQAWIQLHGVAAKVMSDTQTSLDATALALGQAVEMYAATDKAAADELARLRHTRGEPAAGR